MKSKFSWHLPDDSFDYSWSNDRHDGTSNNIFDDYFNEDLQKHLFLSDYQKLAPLRSSITSFGHPHNERNFLKDSELERLIENISPISEISNVFLNTPEGGEFSMQCEESCDVGEIACIKSRLGETSLFTYQESEPTNTQVHVSKCNQSIISSENQYDSISRSCLRKINNIFSSKTAKRPIGLPPFSLGQSKLSSTVRKANEKVLTQKSKKIKLF